MTPNEHDELGLSPTPERYPDNEREYVPDDDDRPTRKQLAYLRSLANRAGQTFAYPRTAAQASREIRRLKSSRPSSRIERELERKEIADAIAYRPHRRSASAAERGHRVRIQRDLEGALVSTPTVTELRRNGNPVGERVELGRYRVGSGERVIVGQRVNGVVRLSDVPAGARGRAYLIERELEQDGYAALKALVVDYLAQAELLGDVPIAASPVERVLGIRREVQADDSQGSR